MRQCLIEGCVVGFVWIWVSPIPAAKDCQGIFPSVTDLQKHGQAMRTDPKIR